MHGDIEKIKAQSKEEYDKSLTLLNAKQVEQLTDLRLDSKKDTSLSL